MQKYIQQIAQRLPLRARRDQGARRCETPGEEGSVGPIFPPRMIRNSASLTLDFSCGRSRNQHQKKAAHATPTTPKIQKVGRQPMRAIMKTTSAGANAPPRRPLIQTIPCPKPRSTVGIHRESTLVALGYVPASPAPKRNRTVSRVAKWCTRPVRVVNADHQRTILVMTLRGPIVSPSQPLGISKDA